MAERRRFLIVSLEGENYGLPVSGLLEITVARNIQKDSNLEELYEGTFEFRGTLIPVLNIKKLFRLASRPLTTLLVVKSDKRILGILVDAVIDIVDTEEQPIPMPDGVLNPELRYYNGILRYREKLVLLLNADGMLP